MPIDVVDTPTDQESLVALITREAAEEWQAAGLSPVILEPCVREAVESLRESQVTTFVPLLALRQVRACLRAGTCDCEDW
jgi:hypothetical protein